MESSQLQIAERLSRAVFVASAVLAGAGLLALSLGSGATNLTELGQVMQWHLARAWQTPVLLPALIVAAVALVAWRVVAAGAEIAFRRELDRGGVAARQAPAVGQSGLVLAARRALEPALRRPRPRVGEVLDAVLGLPVDLGAGELVLEPEAGRVQLVLRVAMDRLPVSEIEPALYETLVAELRRIVCIEGEAGEGQLDLHSETGVEPLRVLIGPGVQGTKVRIQVLGRAQPRLTITELGLPEPAMHTLAEALDAGRGVVLVEGPAHSGVTTTIYAAAHYLDRRRDRPGGIASLEDPVRHDLPFVHQSEVGKANAARLLSALLRRYEVILVRRLEQAMLAEVFSAARSRLIIASLGTTSAGEALLQLRQAVGAERLGDRLALVLAQRLVRRLCPGCRERAELTTGEQRALRRLIPWLDREEPLYRCRGCEACRETGRAGMVPIHQMVRMDDGLRDHLAGPPAALRAACRAPGNIDLLTAALERARAGEISVSELLRLARESADDDGPERS